ncbi:DEAD/DEAH box helicase [Maribacter sp. CXY002]|uniref:DEAD/DEAH box helicase n=1 Tax=Maribacter luteocoastalis TaxID=3407671 RepID=UPI003B67895F
MGKTFEIKKTFYEIFEHPPEQVEDNFVFTRIEPHYSNGIDFWDKNAYEDLMEYPLDGVYGYYDLKGLVDYTNSIQKGTEKRQEAFLTGKYEGGTSGQYKTIKSCALAWDIDAKDNSFLKNHRKADRANVIQVLKQYSLMMGKSSSALGLWGFLYVPELENLNYEERGEFKDIADKIFDYMTSMIFEKTKVKVIFDYSQGAYRQIRFAAHQKEKIEPNYKPIPIGFKKVVKKEPLPITGKNRRSSGYINEGSIFAQFNRNHSPEDFLPACNFTHVNGNRWRYNNSVNSTSGEVKDGVYIANSSTFANELRQPDLMSKKAFTPYDLFRAANNYTHLEALTHLKADGYKSIEPNYDKLKKEVELIDHENDVCIVTDKLEGLSLSDKYKFFREANIPEDLRDTYRAYLGLKDLTVPQDEILPLNGFVSNRLAEIFDIADKHPRLAVTSDTSTGKTYSIIHGLDKHREGARMLLIVPLRGIASQAGKGHKSIIKLFGNVKEQQFMDAHYMQIVVATYPQAPKVLKSTDNVFDYIVLDELHSLILTNDYRKGSIAKLYGRLESYLEANPDTKLIGMTGTPLSLLKPLGYYMLKLKSDTPRMEITQRFDGRNAQKIVMQHQLNAVVKDTDKVIYRVVATKGLYQLKEWLVLTQGYKENEVLVLTGADKRGEDWKRLVEDDVFNNEIKIVLTSPLIDEGVSIKNDDFTQVVFVDPSPVLRPEPLKQFSARLRNPRPDLKIYHYVKVRRGEYVSEYMDDFIEVRDEMNSIINERSGGDSTYKSILSFDYLTVGDNRLNELLLAYEESTNFFRGLSIYDFNEFLLENYNIEVVIDSDYIKENIKLENKDTLTGKPLKERKTYIVRERWLELLTAMFNASTGRSEDLIMITDANEYGQWIAPEEDFESFVSDKRNLEHFMQVVKFYLLMRRHNQEPFSQMFDKYGLLESSSELYKKGMYLKLALTLKQPIDENDFKEKKELESILSSIKEVDTLTIAEFRKLWRTHKLPKNRIYGANTELLIRRFLTVFTHLVWYQKEKRFVRKDAHEGLYEKFKKRWQEPEILLQGLETSPQDEFIITQDGILDTKTRQLELLVPEEGNPPEEILRKKQLRNAKRRKRKVDLPTS